MGAQRTRFHQVLPSHICIESRYIIIILVIVVQLYDNNYLLEKWALCYRNFEHGDTDMNMYVERYDIVLENLMLAITFGLATKTS